jgi:hypothetical protein
MWRSLAIQFVVAVEEDILCVRWFCFQRRERFSLDPDTGLISHQLFLPTPAQAVVLENNNLKWPARSLEFLH